MPDTSREHWIAILEAASCSSPDEMNQEWEWLMDELALPLEYFPAVLDALRQGRWRTAKYPRAYLKTVSKREAVKLGLAANVPFELELVSPRMRSDGSSTSYEETIEELLYKTAGDNDRPEWEYEFNSPWDYFLSKLPEDLKVTDEPPANIKNVYDSINASTDEFHLHMRAPVAPNWKAWGERAGFDEWELLALECRVSRKSREKALAEQPDERSRKALQAAWKQFDRTGMKRLQNALKINPQKNVPDDALSDTR